MATSAFCQDTPIDSLLAGHFLCARFFSLLVRLNNILCLTRRLQVEHLPDGLTWTLVLSIGTDFHGQNWFEVNVSLNPYAVHCISWFLFWLLRYSIFKSIAVNDQMAASVRFAQINVSKLVETEEPLWGGYLICCTNRGTEHRNRFRNQEHTKTSPPTHIYAQ